MNRFEAKSVLVTGAASGIGRPTTVRLTAEGARGFGQAHPAKAGYAGSRAALLSYSLSLAVELGPRRIRVVQVSPDGACLNGSELRVDGGARSAI